MVILWGALLTIHAIDDAASFIFCVNYKIFHLQDLSSDSLLLQTFTNIRRFRKLIPVAVNLFCMLFQESCNDVIKNFSYYIRVLSLQIIFLSPPRV
jgi:hypothetical protein